MANINLTSLAADLITAPKGMWADLISFFVKSFAGFGLGIVILTIIVKLVMSPLDIWQKYSSKVTMMGQKKMEPILKDIKKRYAGNKQLENQKTMEAYKKNGISPMGNCFAMLVNLTLMLVVFITFLNAVNKVASYNSARQFFDVQAAYYEVYNSTYATALAGSSGDAEAEEAAIALATTAAQNEALTVWKQNKESFLWINNIWRNDSSQSRVPTFKSIRNAMADKEKFDAMLSGIDDADLENFTQEEIKQKAEQNFETIMKSINSAEKGKWNGYYILTVLAVVFTYFSSMLMSGMSNKKKNAPMSEQELIQKKTNGITKFLMPGLIGIFTITSNSLFGIYLVVSQLVGIGVALATTPLVNKLIAKKQDKLENKPTISYSR